MNDRRPPIPPAAVLLVGVFAVSTGALFLRLAEEAPALVRAAYRCALATLLLLPFAWKQAAIEWPRLTRREWAQGLGAGIFLALHFATWISSLDYTTVASSVVLVTTIPVWVGLLTPFISTDRVSRLTALGIVISVAGGMVIGWGDFQIGGDALLGDGLALLGAITAACYILLGRRLRQRLSLLPYVTLCYGTAALLLLVLVLVLRLPLVGYAPMTYLWLLAVAVVPQVIGHSSYNWALEWLSASLISVSLLGEPIFSTLLAYLFLGESITEATLWGGALILVGIYFAARGETTETAEGERGRGGEGETTAG